MVLIDIHAHYTLEENDSWRDDLQDVTVVLNGLDAESNKNCLLEASSHKKIKCAVGFHPTHVTQKEDADKANEEIKRIKEIYKNNKEDIIAIGEIGLDYYHSKDTVIIDLQKEVFKGYLDLAEKLKLPVIIHARNAAKDVLEILEKKNFSQKVILHCFEASEKHITFAINKGYYFTIPASVRRNEHFQRLVFLVPVNRMFTETDGPYQGPVKGKASVPKDVIEAIEYISEIKKLDAYEVEQMIFKNYMCVF